VFQKGEKEFLLSMGLATEEDFIVAEDAPED
jgi:hypothetical protein